MIRTLLFLLIFSAVSSAQVKFFGAFESANILSASTIDSVNYVVRTKEDNGGRWFYFGISGVKDKYISVKVENSDVTRAFYSYDNVNFTRFTKSESPQTNVFRKTYAEDTVYAAYYIPYTFSYLQQRIKEWEKSPDVTVDTLGLTDHGFPIQEITITDFSVPDSGKHSVWIHARTHPGETPGSWHFDGIVQALLKDNDVVNYYKKNIVFHLIPFTNPEGVYYGRSRTNFYGLNEETNWASSESGTSTEVKILKKRMAQLNDEKPFSVFFNIHSQAASYCTFWIHTPGSTSERFFRREFQISNLNTSDNPYFSQNDYSQSALKSYYPEGWLWDHYGPGVMALTYETPYDYYSDGSEVTKESLFELGNRTVYALGEFLELSHSKWYLLDNKDAAVSGMWFPDTTGHQFYGDDYLDNPGGTGQGYVEYSTVALESGMYDIYAWWPAKTTNAYNTKFHIIGGGTEEVIEKTQQVNGGEWNFLKEIPLGKSGPISVKITDDANGTIVADAFRIIYKGAVSSVDNTRIPGNFVLYQNYPNPFNPSTQIRFRLKNSAKVVLIVYNSLGQNVETLISEYLQAGEHTVTFNSSKFRGLASGVYYYSLKTGGSTETKSMILLK